ncbi:MAG: hypothetical protein ABI091_11930 [Ferruginibacter sp.]
MKTFVLLLLLAFAVAQSQAQLLRKIRDKAVQAVDTKPTSDNKNNHPGQESVRNGSKAKNEEVPPANCTLVFTLGEDEKFFHDESSIISKNNVLNYAFVIRNVNKEYFLIEDGKRTGPFATAPLPVIRRGRATIVDAKPNENIKIGSDQKDPVTAKYSKTIGGKLYLVFNGKNYGPYDHISKMLVSPDNKHFFASVTIGGESAMTSKMGMGNTFMVSDGNLKMQAGKGMSVPLKFSVSRYFNHCMVTVLDQKTQVVTTVTSSGKRSESSMADLYSNGESLSFVNDNGDIVSVPSKSPTQILINGKEVASFSIPILSAQRLFLMPDYAKSVYYDGGKLYRANGTEENLSGILFPSVITVNGETAVYYFKMIKKELGVKEVYLCKHVF